MWLTSAGTVGLTQHWLIPKSGNCFQSLVFARDQRPFSDWRTGSESSWITLSRIPSPIMSSPVAQADGRTSPRGQAYRVLQPRLACCWRRKIFGSGHNGIIRVLVVARSWSGVKHNNTFEILNIGYIDWLLLLFFGLTPFFPFLLVCFLPVLGTFCVGHSRLRWR